MQQMAGIATLDGIAAALNARGVRTDRGGASHPNAVRNLLARDGCGDRSRERDNAL